MLVFLGIVVAVLIFIIVGVANAPTESPKKTEPKAIQIAAAEPSEPVSSAFDEEAISFIEELLQEAERKRARLKLSDEVKRFHENSRRLRRMLYYRRGPNNDISF